MVACWSNNDFLLDLDAAAGTNVEIAQAIDASLTKTESSIDDVPK